MLETKNNQRKMTTHLKSRNASWSPKGTKSKNLFFSNPELVVFEDKAGQAFVVKDGVKKKSKLGLLKIIDKELKKGFYACGYLSYEYNQNNLRGPKYKAIFNIYKNKSTVPLTPSTIIKDKVKLKKITSDLSFISGVRKARRYIKEGDIYQINLSREFTLGKVENPYSLFLNYYKTQPVEYGAFFNFHDHSLISGSMELFIQKKGQKISTKPIKGTAPLDSVEDKNLNKNLKEISENLMIVDLMRNDLSQICKTGTVKTKKLFKKKSYSTLVQLESEIIGSLKKNITNEKIFELLMPPGSVTGTPKSRAKQIINEIEKHNRGPYCGAVGFFEPSGDFCFSVGIRVAIIENTTSRFFTGAGIVWDSKASKENAETILKSRALKESIK